MLYCLCVAGALLPAGAGVRAGPDAASHERAAPAQPLDAPRRTPPAARRLHDRAQRPPVPRRRRLGEGVRALRPQAEVPPRPAAVPGRTEVREATYSQW